MCGKNSSLHMLLLKPIGILVQGFNPEDVDHTILSEMKFPHLGLGFEMSNDIK